jgi:heme oxygenase
VTTSSKPEAHTAIMSRLKNETAAAHARVDALMDLSRMSRDRYARALAALRDAQLAAESELVRHSDELAASGYDPGARSKVAWLEADLHAIGAFAAPAAHTLLLADPAAAFGAVYVMEGSTLGGQVIARHVMPLLDVTAERGCRYFSGYRADTGLRWRETSAAITRYASDHPTAVDQMIAGANDTFALVESALRSRLAP